MIILNKNRKKRINVETAFSIFKQAKGLMFRKKGRMLFKFDRERKQPFWTVFMRFNLDIIFIGKEKKIVEIKEDISPWRLYIPKKKCKYVLETEAGFAKKNKFKVGDSLEFKQGAIG